MGKVIPIALSSIGMSTAMLFLLMRFGNEAFYAGAALSFFSGLLNIYIFSYDK